MLELLTFPSATTTIANIAQTTNPWFTEFLPMIYISLGVFVAGLLFLWFVRIVSNGFTSFFADKDYDNEMARARKAQSQIEEYLRNNR